MTTVIRTRGLTKTYGRRRALTALTLEIPAGTVFGYLGPNGAGKTTTIRLLAGLLRPSAGSAEINGLDTVRHRELVQRQVGYLPGDFVAYANLTAARYLAYLAALRGGVRAALIDELAHRLDLSLSTVIGTMSHGNKQKVGLVQACMHEPAVLLLDEPTSALDEVTRESVEQTLLRLRRELGLSYVLVTHDPEQARRMADSCLRLALGGTRA